jgi:outer membrane receptor protein involved in Fe transport
MSTISRLAGLLLVTTAFVSPTLAAAQGNPDSAQGAGPETPPPGEETGEPVPAPGEGDLDVSVLGAQEELEVSVPGGNEILVTGRRDRNVTRASDQVVSVLSTAEIARTGEGNIAGALGRVTGLSVVGSGFVYVRGLGDRYSLALLNGSPLPSPEPLRRVVPLDLFPTGVIASSLVQKSYSANFPGEFGGGVINLTTRSTPAEPFLTIGAGVSWDSETTFQTGYTYYGSSSDWTGHDNGNRVIPPALAAFFASGERISSGNVDTQAIAGELVNSRNGVVQRWSEIPANFSGSLSAGRTFPLGGADLGVVAAAGYSNKFQSRDAIQQTSLTADLSQVESDFRRVTTDQRIVANGLLGLALEFGDNTIRWTNLYIHDTIKQTRLGIGQRNQTPTDLLQQDTAWFERQLINTQIVGEFRPLPGLRVDVRGGYANSQREAPFELSFEYFRTNSAADPFGNVFVNRLQNGNAGDASIGFSDLDEDLWSGGVDVNYLLIPDMSVTVGGYYSDTNRTSSRREFLFLAPSNFPAAVGTFRPDLLLQPGFIDYYGIELVETDEANPAFDAGLLNWAGYAKANWQVLETVSLDLGVRYEHAEQTVDPIQVFTVPASGVAGTALENSYWLPAATLTWEIQPDLQLRLSASKTIARPQFRELIYQPYFDPESNRQYLGNPLLIDSQLYNAEARLEWYFAPDQRVSLSGFYKKIDRPIEAFVTQLSGAFLTSYANAPEARLYGGEFEVQKHFDLGWNERRIVVIGNYTFTKSELRVSPTDTTAVFAASSGLATDYFRDGAPLTGQSDHLVNLQLGLEADDHLSQQTILVTYASDRVVSRGLNGTPPQPDVIESPGFRIDFVVREAINLFGQEFEGKLEIRNILGRGHEEFQRSGDNRIEVNSYDLGTTISLSLSMDL